MDREELIKRLRINAKDCGRYIEDEAADQLQADGDRIRELLQEVHCLQKGGDIDLQARIAELERDKARDRIAIQNVHDIGNRLTKQNKILDDSKQDILRAIVRGDYGYIESVYLGYDDDGNPPTSSKGVE